MSVNDELASLYENYFYEIENEPERSEIRRLFAVERTTNLITLCHSIAHSDILEIGCNNGANLCKLSELGFGDRLYGFEISETSVELTNKRGIESLVECRLFDGYSIPYEDGRFDLAILAHVVEHVEHPRQLLREAGRVAKHVFVEVPLEDNYRLKGDCTFDRIRHINVYSRKTIRWLLQTSGFEIVKQNVTTPCFDVYSLLMGRRAILVYPLMKLTMRLVPNVATQIFTYHSAMLCRKRSSLANAQHKR